MLQLITILNRYPSYITSDTGGGGGTTAPVFVKPGISCKKELIGEGLCKRH